MAKDITIKLGMGNGDRAAGHEMTMKITENGDIFIYASGLTECTQCAGWIEEEDMKKLKKYFTPKKAKKK